MIRFFLLILLVPYISVQAPDGIMFPDKACLYLCGIEDRQYKEEKIYCKPIPLFCELILFLKVLLRICSICLFVRLTWKKIWNNNDNLFTTPTSPKCFSVGSCKNYVQYCNNTIRYDTISFFQCSFLQLVSLEKSWILVEIGVFNRWLVFVFPSVTIKYLSRIIY